MRRSFDLAIAVAALGCAVFLLAPLVMVFLNSVGDGLFPTFPPNRFSFAPYLEIPPRWLIGLVHSLELALSSALLACILGTMGAIALVRARIRHRALIDALLRSPLQIPSLVLGIAFLQYVAWLSHNAGVDLRGSFLALLIAHTTVAIPFVLTIVVARLGSFDVRLEEAAHGLGATPIAAFMLVTLPNIAAAVLAGGFFAFLLSLDNVPLSLFLVGSGLNLLPVDLFTAIQFGLTRTVYAVATLVCVGTSLLVVAFYARATSFAVIGRM
jgi:putative spermidine/putrescine transport system permease protein